VNDTAQVAGPVGEAEVEGLGVLDDVGRSILFYDARTSNTFSDTPVSDQELTDIWELAKWPPTAANTQPLRVLYVHTPAGRERLVPLMSEGNRAKTSTAPATAILAADLDFHEHIPTVFPARAEMKDRFAADDDARHAMARFNATLQAGYFLLAIRAAGLAAGPMAGFDKDGVDAEFFSDGRFKSILVVNIGHPGPNPWFDRLPRLANDTAVQWA
jgi:3-hydroxypropanoate dehydrogenase